MWYYPRESEAAAVRFFAIYEIEPEGLITSTTAAARPSSHPSRRNAPLSRTSGLQHHLQDPATTGRAGITPRESTEKESVTEKGEGSSCSVWRGSHCSR